MTNLEAIKNLGDNELLLLLTFGITYDGNLKIPDCVYSISTKNSRKIEEVKRWLSAEYTGKCK